MTDFTLSTNQLQQKAAEFNRCGDELCNLSRRIKLSMAITNPFSPSQIQRINRINILSNQLQKLGNRFISLSHALSDIVSNVISEDTINEEFIKQKLSQVDDTNFSVITALTPTIYQKNEFEKVAKQVVYGDYAEEFSWWGFGINVALGFTAIGWVQDTRDLSHSVYTYQERSATDNALLIGLGIMAFIPLLGDFTKVEAKIIKNGSKINTVVKSLEQTDEITTRLMNDGAKIIGNGETLHKTAETYATLVNSNKPWTWMDNMSGGELLDKSRKEIKQYAIDAGMIPQIEITQITNPITGNIERHADFKGAGLVKDELTLPKELWDSKDVPQFKWLDNQLGYNTSGYTWHHVPDKPGEMQLVPFGIHQVTNHHGGRTIGNWAYTITGR